MAEDEGRCHLPHLPHLPRRYKQHNWCVNSCGEAPLALPGSPLAFSGHKDLSFLSVANHSLIRPSFQRPALLFIIVFCIPVNPPPFSHFGLCWAGAVRASSFLAEIAYAEDTNPYCDTSILCSFPSVQAREPYKQPGIPVGSLISFRLPCLKRQPFDTSQKITRPPPYVP